MRTKHLGQNFLYNPSIIERIVESARLESSDLVVEIGPGPGAMTMMLSKKVGKVIAIELDERLFEKLRSRFSSLENVELIYGDALEFAYEELPEFKVVANIPYYITTPIIFRLLESGKNLKSMTLTVQKEVAERIVAKPGGRDYGVLSIMVQYHARPTLEFFIPKEAFRPSPKVDSAVIYMEVLQKPSVEVKDEAVFFRTVKTAFSQRRKMLANSLRALRPDAARWLTEAGIAPERRPETLSIEEFARLADSLSL